MCAWSGTFSNMLKTSKSLSKRERMSYFFFALTIFGGTMQISAFYDDTQLQKSLKSSLLKRPTSSEFGTLSVY